MELDENKIYLVTDDSEWIYILKGSGNKIYFYFDNRDKNNENIELTVSTAFEHSISNYTYKEIKSGIAYDILKRIDNCKEFQNEYNEDSIILDKNNIYSFNQKIIGKRKKLTFNK